MTDEDRVEYLDAEMREWFEALTPERRAVITARMSKAIEDVVGKWNDDTDSMLIETAFIEVVNEMYTQDIVDDLVAEGLVRVAEVNEMGRLLYMTVDA